jgi:peptide/nickel transport system ATP-binding protein
VDLQERIQNNPKTGENRNILEVNDLVVTFGTHQRHVLAVDGASFTLRQAETLAIVGESGCGKTVTALSILRLIPSPPGRIDSGSIIFSNLDLLQISMKKMQKIRGDEIAMIFQEPMTSLNPVLTVGRQLSEAMIVHLGISRREAEERAVEILKLVQIPEPNKRMSQYPHQMSGGMRQRIMIGIALSCNPKILIADEPTTALDVTVQAQILELMTDIKKKLNTSILFITHDLGVVAEIAERVLFMYTGCVIEEAPVDDIFEYPLHPYSQGLLGAVPRLDIFFTECMGKRRLQQMPGIVPSIFKRIEGCSFAPRCPHVRPHCRAYRPVLVEKRHSHFVACWEVDQWLK